LINAYENQFDEQVNVMCIENMLRNYPYVNGIFVGVSQSIGVIETLKQKNLLDKYKIITVDTFPTIREYLSRGEVVATLDRHPFIMGQIAVRTVYSYLVHPFQMEERILVPPGVVLPSSAHISSSNQNFMELPIMIPEICCKS
jgi:ABC-type sugar transport system substrate-binding protein